MYTTLKKNFALGKVKESEQFYNQLKTELEKEIVNLQMEVGNTSEKISNLDLLLDKSLSFLSNLPDFWDSTDIRNKKEMQDLLFPEGVPYNYKTRQYLTSKTNEYFELVTSLSVPYDETKKEIPTFSGEDSCIVAPIRRLSNRLIERFKAIHQLKSLISLA